MKPKKETMKKKKERKEIASVNNALFGLHMLCNIFSHIFEMRTEGWKKKTKQNKKRHLRSDYKAGVEFK